MKIPEKMKAILLYSDNGPSGLRYEMVQTPKLASGEVLVQVHSCSITRDELDWPVNRLPAIPSYEFSGIVVMVNSSNNEFNIGDEVYGMSQFDRNGAAAEFIKIPSELIMKKPRNLTHLQASTIPLAALSAWQGLFDYGKLEKGQKVLILGASGGVGLFAIQIAKWFGAKIIANSSNEKNIDFLKSLGINEFINFESEFTDYEETVDLVFDTVGGSRLEKTKSIVKKGGKIISIAAEPPKIDNVESVYFVVEPNNNQLRKITELIESNIITSTIDKTFDFDEAVEAFSYSLNNRGKGKIALKVYNSS